MTQDSSANQTADHSADFRAQLESLEIPPNIDPKLLALWLEREHRLIENQENPPKPKPKKQNRQLSRFFAAYIGIVVFCLTIVLGFVQQKETSEILNNACLSFLIYTIIGFFAGWVAEYCVNDSVETLLREIVRRSNETVAADSQPEPAAPGQES
ncbi:MAG: hypothetical protein LBQ50_08350 [Planctomycetaceae bacterium]|jgi:hypothetical protein|nr:hypothetical protein [Planctomycetaceae bacterium]